MTLADVLQAKQALEAAGEVASANKILARLGSGSKKTVLKYLHQLAAAGEMFMRPPGARSGARSGARAPCTPRDRRR